MDNQDLLRFLHDPDRLRVLRELGLLDSPADPAFDRLTQFAARLLNAPVSLVSLVDVGRQFFISSVGLPEPWHTARQTPLSHSFCQYVVASRAPFVVRDARTNPRVADNLAIPDLDVIAYAGVPLITPEGAVLGSLCAIDHEPRDWSDADLALLANLAAGVMAEVGRGRAERAEQQAVAHLNAVLASVPDAIWSADLEYRITTCNQCSATLFAQLTGTTLQPATPLIDFCPPEEYPVWVARYDRALAGETFMLQDSVIVDGTRHWFELSFSPIQGHGGVAGVTVVGRDITTRRAEADTLRHLVNAEQTARFQAEQAAARAARRSALTAALAGAHTQAEVVELTVSQGVAALGAYAGAFVLRQLDEESLRLAAAVGYPPELLAAWPVIPHDAPVPVADAARTRQPVWLPNRAAIATSYPALYPQLALETQAQAIIPLLIGGETVAVIGLSFTTPQAFDADDRDLILAMVEQCAQALDRARLFESLQHELAERRRTEVMLRLRDRAIAASRSGITITDAQQPDNPIISCNPAFTSLTGYPADEALGYNCRFLQGPDTDPAAIAMIRDALAAGEHVQVTLRNYRRDGTPFWNDLAIAPVHDETGQLTHFVGIQTDVTARVEATEALQASEERFARAFAASPVALSIATLAEGRILEANAGFAELTGYQREEFIGQSVNDLALWANPTDRSRLVSMLASQPTVRDIEIRFRTKGGAVYTALVAATTVVFQTERCLLMQVQDITAWKATEVALRASEARFRSLAESAPDCIYVVDMSTRELVYCNRDAFLGYPLATLRQPGALFATVHDDDRTELFAHWNALSMAADSHAHVVEYRMRRADGVWEWLQNRGTVLERDAEGKPSQLMVSISVITSRKQAEEERRALDRALLEAQKLESLGVLAGGIAHDFNNMLVAMLGNAELALLDLPDDHPATPSVSQVQLAARRAAELTGQMLAYSGRGRFVVGPLDLARLVQEMAALLRASLPRAVPLDYRFSEEVPLVEGDATQLRQVVMNLILNAAEAMSDSGGVVRVRVAPCEVDAVFLANCVLGADRVPGQYLALEVRDTGGGMDEATVRRIFEPFFTTKFTGRGLGMAAVQGIVRAHHGAIHIASTPGEGTTVTVLLPFAVASADVAPAPPATAPVTSVETPQTVLVIDDEPEVRRVTARMLERLGYRAVAVVDGEAGLALLDSDSTVAGVLLDLTMPGLSGEETFAQIRQRKPLLPVIVVSGYSEQEVRGRMARAEVVDVMQKPFTPTTLRAVLARMLTPRL